LVPQNAVQMFSSETFYTRETCSPDLRHLVQFVEKYLRKFEIRKRIRAQSVGDKGSFFEGKT
jgi:hypothetical protein